MPCWFASVPSESPQVDQLGEYEGLFRPLRVFRSIRAPKDVLHSSSNFCAFFPLFCRPASLETAIETRAGGLGGGGGGLMML